MDMSKYIGIFRVESEKYIKELSDSLLALEKDPESTEQMNIIFRAAHTFKGMASTMGFREIVELTHEMENLIDRLRMGELTLNSSLIDILFKCLDALEGLVDNACKDKRNGLQQHKINADEMYESSPDACEVLTALKTINEIPKKNCSQKNEDYHPSAEIKDYQEKYYKDGKNPGNQMETESVGVISEHAYKTEPKVFEIGKEGNIPASLKSNLKIKNIQSSRISTKKLDKLMNLVGELATNRSRVKELVGNLKSKELDLALSESYKLIRELQEEVIEARMLPLDQITHVYPRMIRDLARVQNKEINFIIKGKEIKLDRIILEEIGDSLVHLLRNAVDHGIELPETRTELGKEEAGTITITASRQENFALIKIEDDGSGINTEEIRKIALEKGMISKEEAEKLQEREVMQLIFAPGLSTTNTVTDISGRGVGMDVVKDRIERLGGAVKVESKPGSGSSFELKLPLTIALYQVMLIKVGKERYAIPFTNIVKNIEINEEEIRYINREEAIIISKKVIPLLRLHELFQLPARKKDISEKTVLKKENIPVVIIERAGQEIGIVVDELIGKQEVIVKNFKSRLLDSTRGFAGATILGDGDVVLIIAVNSLI
jgi:two-component system chemotaxis sensor kinase CheA